MGSRLLNRSWQFEFSILFILMALFIGGRALAASSGELLNSVDEYQARYRLGNVDQKLVDNHGDGYQDLYGTRNFRAVLSGLVYRGGANNSFHHTHPRSNMNPLPDDGLMNLCEEGFTEAVYLYPDHFGTAPKVTNCHLRDGSAHQLHYVQRSPLSSTQDRDAIVKIVYDKLNGGDPKPIYVHCWNGWHASGYTSAILLRQFCGMSAANAVAYWNRNTDGNNGSSYESIRQRIRNYHVNPQMPISDVIKEKICPQ